MVAPDETGWRVGGARAWLWAFVGAQVTVYRIAQGRGFKDAAAILGEGYAGVLERDGWAPYRRFEHAAHQSCLAHLLRRCRELISDAIAGQAKTPHAVRRILEHALALREDRDAAALDAGQLAAEVQALEAAVDRLVAGATRYPPNRRLLDHLARERDHLFTFLRAPACRPPTGAPSRPSELRWSAARPGAATAPGPAPTPGRPSPVWGAPPASKATTPLSCSPACYQHQRRSWPTSPSPGADQHTRYLNTDGVAGSIPAGGSTPRLTSGTLAVATWEADPTAA